MTVRTVAVVRMRLARQRGDLAKALAAAEDEWLQLSAEVELAAR